jgi:orotate phosphoribosyltransferase
VAILEDTTTTGGAVIEAAQHALEAGLVIVQAISLVDRSSGAAGSRFNAMGVPYRSLILPEDLGVA